MPFLYNDMENYILRNKRFEKAFMLVIDVLDSEDGIPVVERTHLNEMFTIQCNFLEYEHLAFL